MWKCLSWSIKWTLCCWTFLNGVAWLTDVLSPCCLYHVQYLLAGSCPVFSSPRVRCLPQPFMPVIFLAITWCNTILHKRMKSEGGKGKGVLMRVQSTRLDRFANGEPPSFYRVRQSRDSCPKSGWQIRKLENACFQISPHLSLSPYTTLKKPHRKIVNELLWVWVLQNRWSPTWFLTSTHRNDFCVTL